MYRITNNNVDRLFALYEPLALFVAQRITSALYFLPSHIKDEFIHQSRYSLICTLNHYSNKKVKSSIKNLIIWRCYTDLSRWWCRTYTGCHELITQQKYKILPISKEQLEEQMEIKLEDRKSVV